MERTAWDKTPARNRERERKVDFERTAGPIVLSTIHLRTGLVYGMNQNAYF